MPPLCQNKKREKVGGHVRLGGQDTDDDLTSSDEDGETTANQTMTPETRPAAHMLYEVDHVSPCPVSHYSSPLCKP